MGTLSRAGIAGAVCVVLGGSGCRSTGERPSARPAPDPAPTATSAAARDAGGDAGDPGASSSRPSPFAVVATVGGFGRVHALADGELLFASRGVFRRLTAGGAIERIGDIDTERRGLEIANNIDAIQAVGGAWPSPIVVAANQGHFRSRYVSRTFAYDAGRFVERRAPTLSYDKILRWKDDVLLGHVSGAAYDASPFQAPEVPTRFAIVRGKKVAAPELPKDFVVIAWTAFTDGRVIASGSTREPDSGPLEATRAVLAWEPGATKPTTLALPDLPEAPWIDGITGPRADDLWLSGRGGYLAHRDARGMTKVPTPCAEIVASSAGPDGPLYLVCGDERRKGPHDHQPVVHKTGTLFVRAGSSFEEVPLPDFTKATYADKLRSGFYAPPYGIFVDVEDDETVAPPDAARFVLHAVAARGSDDVWLLAYDAEADRTAILRRGARAPVRALDHEDAVRENETPAPAATRACQTVFVSLGEPTDEALKKAARVQGLLRRLFVARVHQARHLGFVVSEMAPRALAEAQSEAAHFAKEGFSTKLLCRTPVALSMPIAESP
ncbi:MAG: hypothetical protein KF850_31710 [Labilithrix sp.]|nr:hypothetical protein [Labilithrix sp.]MBX3216646.1 hypothetical protein [Labilithrix sp.]